MAVAAPERAGRREWIALGVLVLPTLLASLELTVPNLALPTIAESLRLSGTQQLWVVDVYGFLLAGSLVTMGVVGDRIGRRRTLLIGAAGFAVASVVAAMSTSFAVLVTSRAVLGVAGATLMPSALALAAALFRDPRQRTTAIGAVIASVAGGTALGPLVGGALLDHFWWGSAFLVPVPIAVLLLVLGPRLLPEHREPVTGRLDVLGAALSVAAVLAVVYGLKSLAVQGIALVPVIGIIAGIALAAAFAVRQRTAPHPLVDLTLFRVPAFGGALAALALGVFVLFGANFFLAQSLQLVHGLTPLHAGLLTAPSAVAVIAGSTLAPVLARRWRAATIVAIGLVVAAGGFVVLTQAAADGGAAVLVAGAIVVSAGLGPMMTLLTDLVVAAAPADRTGLASGLSETAPELGGSLGIAVLGSIGAAVYRAHDLPGAAGRSLDDAVRAGSALAAARDAFTSGLHVAAGVSAAVAVLAAVLVLVVLRGRTT